MNAVDTSSDSSSPDDRSQQFAAVRMPIEKPVGDFDEAVQKLRQCPSSELQRARQHHRRALESLRQGSYSALSESTRNRLMGHLRRNLKALNHALDATDPDPDTANDTETKGDDSSVSPDLRDFFQSLW